MINNRVERFAPATPREVELLTRGKTTPIYVELGGKLVRHHETPDFETTDPWSVFKRHEIGKRRIAGLLTGKNVTEAGSGDGRNAREIGYSGGVYTGIEVEEWRNATAWTNLVGIEGRPQDKVQLWTGDVVDYLKMVKEKSEEVDGLFVACVPQSPEGFNTADKISKNPNLIPFAAWRGKGLELNAAMMDSLRDVAAEDLRALVIISDRVLPEDQEKLFRKTGWEIISQAKTKEPVQQDPDTGVEYVAAYDDGMRFWERENNIWRPISAVIAEERRKASMATHQGRKNLNAYHHLTEFELVPRR